MLCKEIIDKKAALKTSITGSVVCDIKLYYLSLYRSYLLELYDLNYISDPTCFKEKEIINVLKELGVTELQDALGNWRLESGYVNYVRDTYQKDSDYNMETAEFLCILYNVLYNRERVENLDHFYVEEKINPNSKKRIQLYYELENSHLYTISEDILKCYYSLAYSFEAITNYDLVYAILSENLGYEPVLDDRLTVNQTIKHLPILLDLRTPCNDEVRKDILNMLGMTILSTDAVDLYSCVIEKFKDKYEALLNSRLDTLTKLSKDVIAGDRDHFYARMRQPIPYAAGHFSVLCDIRLTKQLTPLEEYHGLRNQYEKYYEEFMPEANNFLGYTGQVYSQTYLDQHELAYTGCPIKLFNQDGEWDYYYDIENTELIQTQTVFESQQLSLEFDTSAPDTYIPKKNKLSKIEKQLVDMLNGKERGNFRISLDLPTKPLFTLEGVRTIATCI